MNVLDQLTREGDFLVNRLGNYRALIGGAAYCAGVVPDDGFEIMRIELKPWLPIDAGYSFIEAHLARIGRPAQSFCGIEFRIPAPLTMKDWGGFNLPYFEHLRRLALMREDLSCVCRSNIAPALHAPDVTSLCAFSYTVPSSVAVPTFLMSGQADIDASGRVIAEGDISPEAMRQRTRFVIDAVSGNLRRLRIGWSDATRLALFHANEIPDLWGEELLGGLGEVIRRGVLVFRARPPITGGEVELEARAIRQEGFVATS